MPIRNLTISNLWQLVTVDTNNLPLKVKNTYIPAPTIDGLSLGGVKQGTNITIALDGTISATGAAGSTLQGLTDVSIVEPTLIDTTNTITAVDATTITVSAAAPISLAIGDWISGISTANSKVTQITAIVGQVITVAATATFGFTVLGLIYKISSTTLSGQVLTWNVPTNKWIAQPTNYSTVQNATGIAVTQRPIIEFTGSGVSSVLDDAVGGRTVVTITGGGGGGTFTASSVWTGGTGNKNAYLSPGNINNVGITINLVASSGSGGITAAVVSLNGAALSGTYASTGTWPNLVITIPVADLIGNAAEIANSVLVSLVGTFGGSGANIANAGTLTNTQPGLFTTTLTGSYAIASAPYYTTTATLSWVYGNTVGTFLAFGGTFTPPGSQAPTATGSFPNVAITGSTIGGSAVGNGTAGAGSRTISLSGSVAAIPTFIPAFWVQTSDATVPIFTTASSQTPGAAQGSIITYTVAAAITQYNWVCTQRPLANLILRTSFGDGALVPDVTGPDQTLSGQVFQVYGWTRLGVGISSILVIT